MKISYISACFDSSGYAAAARNNIVALHMNHDIKVAVVPISFERARAELGKLGNICRSLRKEYILFSFYFLFCRIILESFVC